MLINRIWQPVPGAQQAEIYPFIRKPDVLSSNAFLIRTPEAILLIDPGAIREQAVALHEIITGLIREKPRPVLVYLTHCHIDHSLLAAEFGPLKDLADIHAVVHEAGAKALRASDRRLTLAELYGRPYPHFQLDIRDFNASASGISTLPRSLQERVRGKYAPNASSHAISSPSEAETFSMRITLRGTARTASASASAGSCSSVIS